MSTPPDSLAERYGAPSRRGRLVVLVVAGALTVAFLGWLAWATVFHADPAVSSQEIGHEIVDDHRATIKVRIAYGDDPVDATCRLRALAHDKAVVGETTYEPDPDAGAVHEIDVRTERRATTVEWIGCTAEGQPRPR
ncbi:DUF4307 domain-containing protein [Nocardioides sp. SYSU DS0651]|uniref:DUF4307 domain-containing protein n=1 Tax=Nocardioides sp. SYSU DS0651 TaxID=3415955 RepID=UPI003F4BB085